MPLSRLAYSRITAFGVTIVLLALGGILAWDRFSVTGAALDWVRHGYDVRGALRELTIALDDAETGQRGYLLTGSDSYLQPYAEAFGRIPGLQAMLASETAGNPLQQQRLAALAVDVRAKLDELDKTIRLKRAGNSDAALTLVRSGQGQALMQRIRATMSDLVDEESRLLAERLDDADTADRHARWAALGVATVAILALGVAANSLRRALERAEQAEAQQRRIAAQFERCLHSLTQGVAVFDPTMRLSHANRSFRGLLGLEADDLPAGLHYTELATRLASAGEAFLETAEQIRLAASGPDAGAPIGYQRTRDPGNRSFDIRRTSLVDGGFVLTITDQTDAKQAEAALRDGQKMLAIGRLTGGVAHDFNNLLMVVLGNLEWVRRRVGDDAEVLARVDRAIWGAERGATLTRQLLAFARRQPLEPKPLDVGALTRDMTSLLGRTLGETVQITLVDSAGLWPALVDSVRLESALLNLALNARDAMPDGGRLTIELGNRTIDAAYAGRHIEVQPGDYVMVAISDSGAGMTPEVRDRAFEPFFTTKSDTGGTGLGLSMVHGFVKQLGGHIKLYSEVGEGTTVKLYLPRASGTSVVIAAAPPEEPAPPGLTVLLVEDEAAVREIAAAMLRELGYGVGEAASGEAAVALLAASPERFDLLLVDVILPGALRGRDLSSRLLAIRPDLPVIYMSGYTANAIVHHGRLDEGVTLLNKPFGRHDLARAIAAKLNRPQIDPASGTA